MKNVEERDLVFSINDLKKTASLVKCNLYTETIAIPTSVTYESQKNTVTSIKENSLAQLQIKFIQFESDSELQTIEKNAFYDSKLESISIPATVCELKDGWLNCTPNLKKVIISPKNPNFKNCDENSKLIIGKSDIKSDEFDVLIFASREIKTVTIPPYIKKISPNSFSYSNIEMLSIPATFCELKDEWCEVTKKLNKVVISPENPNYKNCEENDKLIIGKSDMKSNEFDVLVFACRDIETATIPPYIKKISPFAFSDSNIKTIFIPSNVIQICKSAFSYCKNLTKVEFESNSKLEIIEENAFSSTEIEQISIPSNISEISNEAFQNNRSLKSVEFPPDSKLQKIGKKSFAYTALEHVFIPSKVTKICGSAFYNCYYLKSIEFAPDSQLKAFEERFLAGSIIESILVPASVCEFKEYSCDYIETLKKLAISPDNQYFKNCEENDKLILGKSDLKNDIYDTLVFACRDIETVTIPSQIRIICKGAFFACRQLTEVEFKSDSKLEIIEENAFVSTSISKITIPSHVKEIKDGAFDSCYSLQKVDFQPDSELRIIGAFVFRFTYIEEIFIPRHVTTIGCGAFDSCQYLKRVEFASDSELETIESVFISNNKVESIALPASVRELKDGCFGENWSLIKVTINPENPNYKNCEENDKLIIGKSDMKSNEFDVLVFACRDIETATIPPYIKKISPFAFSNSNIKTIFIPSNVIQICKSAFSYCKNLTKVEFESNSKLEIIETSLFCGSESLEQITIPSHVKEICKDAFNNCTKLRTVEFQPNSELQIIDQESFKYSGIEKLFIPSSVTRICQGAFSNCEDLKLVEFPPDSKVQLFEKDVFRYSEIECISIPPSVIELKDAWNAENEKLTKIVIMEGNPNFKNCEENDKLIIGKSDINSDVFDTLVFACRDIETVTIPPYIKKISSYALACTKIESISIPSQVTQICDGAFSDCQNLTNVDIPIDSKLEIIDQYAFLSDKFESILIPKHVRVIGEGALPDTINRIDISPDSELQIIGRNSFFSFNIRSFVVPKHVKRICEGSFALCKNLYFIDILPDSELEVIEYCSFEYSALRCFFIPPKITSIQTEAFNYCYDLAIIELDENVRMAGIGPYGIICHRSVIYMVPTKLANDFIKVVKIPTNNF